MRALGFIEDLILDAVDVIASEGWKLLPDYVLEVDTGLWRHVNGVAEPPLSLSRISYDGGGAPMAAHRHADGEGAINREFTGVIAQ